MISQRLNVLFFGHVTKKVTERTNVWMKGLRAIRTNDSQSLIF